MLVQKTPEGYILWVSDDNETETVSHDKGSLEKKGKVATIYSGKRELSMTVSQLLACDVQDE